MKSIVECYLLISLLLTAASSAPAIGFNDLVGASTRAPSTHSNGSALAIQPTSPTTPLFSIRSLTAASTIESTYKNWVGPLTKSRDTACYREAHFAKTCPLDFNHKLGMCWAQCPL
ncbi:hypothetical protein PR003_g14893, partial [Phytophthora rubi]